MTPETFKAWGSQKQIKRSKNAYGGILRENFAQQTSSLRRRNAVINSGFCMKRENRFP